MECIKNILRMWKTNRHIPIVDRILRSLCDVVFHIQDVKILCEAFRSVEYLASFGDELRHHFIERGIIKILIELLSHKEITVIVGSLRALNEIVSTKNEFREYVLENNVLANFKDLLCNMNLSVRQEALNFLSKLSEGSQTQVQAVINPDFLKNFVENLMKGGHLAGSSVRILKNIVKVANSNQLKLIIQLETTLPLCKLLNCNESDISMVSLIILKTIFN